MTRGLLLACVAIVAVVAGCQENKKTSANDLLAEAGDTEFGWSGGCPDTIRVAKKAGVDYEKLLDECLAKDTAAMHTLFTITKTAGFDAASSEGHATVLGALMRKLGDEFFGKCLEAEPADMQAAVRDQLVYDAGYDPPHLNEIPNLKKNFPRTFPATYEY